MSVAESEADSAERTLYELIVDETGIEYDEDSYNDVEEYKNQLVRFFGKERKEPEDFERMDAAIQEWANDATDVFNANRKAKTKKTLPAIDGLAEPEVTPRRGRGRGRAKAEEPVEKEEKVGRNPDASRYARVMPHYMKNHDVTVEEVKDLIQETEGVEYSIVTLERALVAAKGIVGWLERNGHLPAPK